MTNAKYVKAEIKRLRIAAADMEDAAGAAHQIAEGPRMYSHAEEALEAGAIVSYARPFTRAPGDRFTRPG